MKGSKKAVNVKKRAGKRQGKALKRQGTAVKTAVGGIAPSPPLGLASPASPPGPRSPAAPAGRPSAPPPVAAIWRKFHLESGQIGGLFGQVVGRFFSERFSFKVAEKFYADSRGESLGRLWQNG